MKKYCSSTKSGIRRQKLWTTTSWEPYVSWMWFGSKGYSVGKNQEKKRLLTWDQTTSLCKSAPLLQKNQGDGRRRTKAGQQRQEKEDDFNSYRPWKARGHEIYKHVCLLNERTLLLTHEKVILCGGRRVDKRSCQLNVKWQIELSSTPARQSCEERFCNLVWR